MANKFLSFFRRKILRIQKDRWDYQYSKGQWNSLRTEEMKRISVAADLLRKYAKGGAILEIGCGEGVFFHNLSDVDYRFYEGIDLSQVAISRIPEQKNSYFRSADMETYEPSKSPFSVIILNEVLYYSKNPLALLKRYSNYLSKDGIFLVGMHDTKKSNEIWAAIDQSFAEIDSVKVEQNSKAWYYKTFNTKFTAIR